VRLAPLYDVASVLPYSRFDVNRVKLAMKVGEHYRMRAIGRRGWIRTADQLRVESDSVIARIHHMAVAIPDLATQIGTETRGAGIADPIVDRLVTRLVGRARLCLKQIG